MNDKISIREYLQKFEQSPLRANAWDAIFIMSILTAVYWLWKGPVSFALMNVFIIVAVWWVNQLEKELTRRNQGKS